MTIPQHSGQPNALDSSSLNSRDIVFFVVAAAAPLTVMVAVAPIALLIGGIGAPAGYLCAGLISTVFAIGFTKMARHVHNNGAFYSYIRMGLGKVAGLGSALVAVAGYTLLQISTYGLFGAVTKATMNDFVGVDYPGGCGRWSLRRSCPCWDIDRFGWGPRSSACCSFSKCWCCSYWRSQ